MIHGKKASTKQVTKSDTGKEKDVSDTPSPTPVSDCTLGNGGSRC